MPGNGDGTDQDYALVVSNAQEQNAPVLTPEQVVIDDPAPADNDDQLEPAEPFLLDVNLRNGGDTGATGVSGTISGNGLLLSPPNASWSNIASNQTGTNTDPFEGQLSASAACGADVTATLALSTNQGATTVPVTLPTGEAGSPVTRTGGAVAIPDESSVGAASTISVAAAGLVKDLDVRITSLAHPWVGDLAIDLTSPEGTTVRLVQHPGGPDNGGDNLINTVFDDEAPTNISQGAAPYTGAFKPQNDQLSRFDGQQQQGTWTLRVRDLFEGDTGTLNSWQTTTRRAICDFQDHVPPDTSISAGPSATTASRTASFSFVSSEGGSRFDCSLDGGPAAPCESPHTVSDLSEGTHTLRVQALDQADNLDPSPAERSWTVDTTAPTVSLASPRPGAVVLEARPQLSGAGGLAAGDAGTVTVKLWRGSVAAGLPTQTLSVPRDAGSGAWSTLPATLTDGAWTARAEQADAAGNTGVSVPVTFTIGTADTPLRTLRSSPRSRISRMLARAGSPSWPAAVPLAVSRLSCAPPGGARRCSAARGRASQRSVPGRSR